MKRPMVLGALILLMSVVQAHFVFVVPGKDNAVTVVFSDSLEADDAVTVEKIAKMTLRAREASGKETVLECKAGKHELTTKFPAGTQLAYGAVQYGITTRGETAALLVYYPKYMGPKIDAKMSKLTNDTIDIVTESKDGKVRFQVLVKNKPTDDVEVTVMLPDNTKEKAKTDKDGFTKAFDAKGRYGAWAKTTTDKSGEIDGKKYSETRHYATLVVDLP